MKIEDAKKEVALDIREAGDSFDQYAYVISLSLLLPPMHQADKCKKYLVRGCQSDVWMRVSLKDGFIQLAADSDTRIIRGILYLFLLLVNGRTADEVLSPDLDFLKDTDIADAFPAERQAGFQAILHHFRMQLQALQV